MTVTRPDPDAELREKVHARLSEVCPAGFEATHGKHADAVLDVITLVRKHDRQSPQLSPQDGAALIAAERARW